LKFHDRAEKLISRIAKMTTREFVDESCSLIADLLEELDGWQQQFDCENIIDAVAQMQELGRRAEKAESLAERLATDALTSLAGIVCTPAEGYLKAPHCLSGDIGNLRKLEEVAIKRAISAEKGWEEALKTIKELRAESV
jgi:hypothetical protein